LKFMVARAGDHLVTPFQCDDCHFQNIMGRNPNVFSTSDKEVLEYIRRATLDAFWDRSVNTIGTNLRDALRIEGTARRLGMPPMAPPMGPFPLEDKSGMRIAIGVLERSLDPGAHEEFVQWATFRKSRSVITNISQAGVNGLGDAVGAYEQKKMWISNVPTHQFWFSRFMSGLHKRVGELVKQDEPISIDVLHAALNILEIEWAGCTDDKQRKRVAELGVWFAAGFCSGLRGEEMILIERAGTFKSLTNLNGNGDPWFKLVVSGPTKGNQLSGSKFAVPMVHRTSGTGIEPGKWILRLEKTLSRLKIKSSRLFTRRLLPPRLFEFQDDFFTLLEKVQATTNFIPADVDVRNDYGILRSLRRGVTSHARNMGVDESLLHLFNRWRTAMKNSSGIENLDMADTYSKLETLIPALLGFSRPL
jgi:hypothetical protein